MASEGEGPYRASRPLNEIIPPDRRKERTIAVVLASMVAGGILFQLLRSTIDCGPEPRVIAPAIVSVDPPPTYVPPAPVTIPKPGPLTQEEIESVVAAHRTGLSNTCWRTQRPDAPATAKVTVSIIVGANGEVVSAASSGTDPTVSSCVEDQVRVWRFPAHDTRSSTIQIPFAFARE